MDVGGESAKRGDWRIHDNLDDLATDLADYVAEFVRSCCERKRLLRRCIIWWIVDRLNEFGLRNRKLCEAHYQRTVDWAKWHIFWVDERVVAKNHPDCNYKLAKDGLLSKVPIIPSHVYSINDSISTEQAAEEYGFVLRQLVKTRVVDVLESSNCPKFDLILLGMGQDGHVASLFPDHSAMNEKDEWVTFITDSPKPPTERITFTLPVINSARNVVVVVTGRSKAQAVCLAIGETVEQVVPARLVSPSDGKLVWFLDSEAASEFIVSHSVEGS